jgi:hypothetical protein
MKKEDINRAFEELKVKLLIIFRQMLEEAPNPKTGEHTLDSSSDIYKDTKVEQEDMGLFNVIIPYYIQYIDGINNETGQQYPWARRPKALRGGYQGGPSGFVEAIELWMRKRNISLENGALWRMVNGIEKNGILARPVFNGWEKKVDEILEDWLDTLFDAIVKELDEYFNA